MGKVVKETTSKVTENRSIDPKVISITELLSISDITFPIYQRPYKWSIKNVTQLIQDINTFKDKPAYRLGTVVIHQDEKGSYNIVDGQQRTITIILVFKAIIKRIKNKELELTDNGLRKTIEEIKSKLPKLCFTNDITIRNIKQNYLEIERLVAKMDESIIHFFLYKCEVVKFVLTDISEAFQFFDAQNSRGKDLDPHDLLKAFHLREFSKDESEEITNTVDAWEHLKTDELVDLFGQYLFRIIGWSKGKPSRFFTKNEVDLFKGITLNKIDNYPYVKPLRIVHFFTEDYNKDNTRNIDLQKMNYPFQLDQSIINGKRFFEFTAYYKKVIDHYRGDFLTELDTTLEAQKIIHAINNYQGRYRDGDKYVRVLFDCALIYYHDKFGATEIARVLEKIFIWAYKVRLKQQAVYLSTADNYVLDNNIFKVIKEAILPSDVLAFHIPLLDEVRIKNHSSLEYEANDVIEKGSLIDIFKNLKYYHG